jgi:hypothetical protein
MRVYTAEEGDSHRGNQRLSTGFAGEYFSSFELHSLTHNIPILNN